MLSKTNMANLLGIPCGTILTVTIVNDNAVGAKSSATKSKQNITRAVKRQKSFESLHSMPAQPRRGIRRQSTPYPIKRPDTSEHDAPFNNKNSKAEQQVLSRWGEERPARTVATQKNTSPKSGMLCKPTRSSDSLLDLMASSPGRFQDHPCDAAVQLRPNLQRWGEGQQSRAASQNNDNPTNKMAKPSRSTDSLLELLASSAKAVQGHSYSSAVLLAENHHHDAQHQWTSVPPKQPIRAVEC